MAENKTKSEEESDAPAENASPVCYANSPELRPGFYEELEKEPDIKPHTGKEKKKHNPRKTDEA